MRSSRIIVPGLFCGATIEPGTFHIEKDSARPFCVEPSARNAPGGLSEQRAQVANTSPAITQVKSAPGEDVGAPIPPSHERAADAKVN